MMRLMTFFFLFLIHCIGFSQNRVLIVSDIDDTIKVSGNTKDDFAKYLNTKIEYTGMSHLYNVLLQKNSSIDVELDYVTNAPSFIKRSRVNFLKFHKYPDRPIYFNDDIKGQSHKYKTIKNLIDLFKPHKIILIGDTATKDTEVYVKIKKELLDTPVYVYIHKIYTDKTTTSSNDYFSYITTPELAYKMYLDGFITDNIFKNYLDNTLNAVINEFEYGKSLSDFDLSFPPFMECSSFKWTLPDFDRLNAIKNYLEKNCH